MERKRERDRHWVEGEWEGAEVATTQQLMRQMKRQIAVANAHELLSNMTLKCFQKCVQKPRAILDAHEQKCITMCMDRFMESYRLVSHTYGHRLQRERDRERESNRRH